MALTERKGRFTVVSSPARATRAAPDPLTSCEKRVKKVGRFTVVSSCLPCAGGVKRTLSSDSDCDALSHEALLAHDQRGAGDDAAAALLGVIGEAADCSSTATSSDRDSSPFKDQSLLDSSSWESASTSAFSSCTQDSKASHACSSKAGRKVRFSEPGATTPGYAGAPSAAAAAEVAGASLPKPITRSYCRGRFVVQEAVLVCSLPRSMSVPAHCTLDHYLAAAYAASPAGAAASSAQHREQSAAQHGPCTTGGQPLSLNHQQFQHLLAAQQLQQHSLAHAAAATAAAAGDSFWAAASAAALGEVGTLSGTLSDDLVTFNGAGSGAAAAVAVAGVHRNHKPPKRSQTVSYFRRGRFLVQTTYT